MTTDVLKQFTRRPPPEGERCDLCGEPLPAAHRHLVDTSRRSLKCACPPCHLLFTRPGAGQGRFRAVPDRYLTDPGFELDEADWNRLQIPVALAFFFRNSELDRLAAFYPSPAGATESELDPLTWDAVLGRSRLAELLEPDVEALLLHRGRGGSVTCTLVPVDVCYELVGRMRLHWKGFDGGAEARADIAEFFERITAAARPLDPEPGPTGASTHPGASSASTHPGPPTAPPERENPVAPAEGGHSARSTESEALAAPAESEDSAALAQAGLATAPAERGTPAAAAEAGPSPAWAESETPAAPAEGGVSAAPGESAGPARHPGGAP